MQTFKVGDIVKRQTATSSMPYGEVTKVHMSAYRDQTVDIRWGKPVKWRFLRKKMSVITTTKVPSRSLRGLTEHETMNFWSQK